MVQVRQNLAAFPSAEALFDDGALSAFIPLLPTLLVPLPATPGGRGHRVRVRFQNARKLIMIANDILRSLNLLDGGLKCKKQTVDRCVAASEAAGESRRRAVEQLHARVLEHAAVFAQERQLLQPGKLGAQIAAELIKADHLDRYTLQAKAHNQEPIRAVDLDEPSADTPSVDMLAALPFRER